MSLLADLKTILTGLEYPVETGVFTSESPSTYTVLTPIYDDFDNFCDNKPEYDVQEVRISIYTQGNYTTVKNNILRELLDNDITITSKGYIGYEETTKYHHYTIDCENLYSVEELLSEE